MKAGGGFLPLTRGAGNLTRVPERRPRIRGGGDWGKVDDAEPLDETKFRLSSI